jgi:hypothetical protein
VIILIAIHVDSARSYHGTVWDHVGIGEEVGRVTGFLDWGVVHVVTRVAIGYAVIVG